MHSHCALLPYPPLAQWVKKAPCKAFYACNGLPLYLIMVASNRQSGRNGGDCRATELAWRENNVPDHVTCPRITEAIDCTLIVTPEVIKRKGAFVVKNMTCVMHVHVHPSEFMSIMVGVKDITDKQDAMDKLLEFMIDTAEKLDLNIRDVKTIDPVTCAVKEEE